jgi:hypothetical protein
MVTTRMTWSILDTEEKVFSLPKMPFRLRSLLQWILPRPGIFRYAPVP